MLSARRSPRSRRRRRSSRRPTRAFASAPTCTPWQTHASRRRSLLRPGRGVALARGLLLAAAAVGSFVLGSRASSSTPGDTETLAAGGARLALPPDWMRLAPAPALGLELESEVAADPAPDRGIVVGTTAAAPPTYLPAGLPQPIARGGAHGASGGSAGPPRGFPLPQPGSRRRLAPPHRVRGSPRGSDRHPRLLPAHRRIAVSRRVRERRLGRRALPLLRAAGAAYARAFNGVDRRFKTARTAGLGALGRAKTPATQAVALSAVADTAAVRAGAAFADHLARSAHRDVLARFRTLRHAYRRAADAVVAADRDGYLRPAPP